MLNRFAQTIAVLSVISAGHAGHAWAGESDAWFTEEYAVSANETLDSISRRTNVPRDAIAAANGLKEPFLLRAGSSLRIPRGRIHVVRDNETSFAIALDHGVPWQAIAAANGLDYKDDVKSGQYVIIPVARRMAPATRAEPESGQEGLGIRQPEVEKIARTKKRQSANDLAKPNLKFVWPVRGTVRRPFADRQREANFHDGIDILVLADTIVKASAPGKVVYVGRPNGDYGLTVTIDHGQNWTTTYAFLIDVAVMPDDLVMSGDPLGRAGTSKRSDRPQLHFELKHNSMPVDPAKYLVSGVQPVTAAPVKGPASSSPVDQWSGQTATR